MRGSHMHQFAQQHQARQVHGFIKDFHQGGGANLTIAELRGGGKDYSNTSNAFSLARNIIELIDFLKLGGSVGMLPQENFEFFNL